MAIKTIDELRQEVSGYAGERTDDLTDSLLEDVSDTLESLREAEIRISEAEKKAAQIDDEWRRKYIERFKGGDTKEESEPEPEEKEEKTEENITVKDIMKEVD